MRSKLNSTQKIVVNFLQQLVTECTDRVPVTQPCTVASTTGYIVYRPGTALYSCFNNWLQSLPTRYRLHSLCTAYLTPLPPQLVTESSDPVHSTLLIQGQIGTKNQPSHRVFYQLATLHQQPIHWPKTDNRPNNV